MGFNCLKARAISRRQFTYPAVDNILHFSEFLHGMKHLQKMHRYMVSKIPFQSCRENGKFSKKWKRSSKFFIFCKKTVKIKAISGWLLLSAMCWDKRTTKFHLILHIFNFVRLNSTWGMDNSNLQTGYPWDIIGNKAKKANLKTRVTRKQSTSNFPKNEHCFPWYAHARVQYLGKKCSFFVKYGMFWFLETPVLRTPPFVLLATIYTLKLMVILN